LQYESNRCDEAGVPEYGHAEIHEHDVWAQLVGERNGLNAVCCGADDFDVVGEPDEHRQAFADGALVVRDDDVDHPGTSSSTREPVSVGPACMWPPARSSRSRIPFRPLPPAVLTGLILDAAIGWWWADPAAAFVIVYYGLREGRHALRETSSSR
jgi:hypothetical protein